MTEGTSRLEKGAKELVLGPRVVVIEKGESALDGIKRRLEAAGEPYEVKENGMELPERCCRLVLKDTKLVIEATSETKDEDKQRIRAILA